jgi:putative sterol carrier protein
LWPDHDAIKAPAIDAAQLAAHTRAIPADRHQAADKAIRQKFNLVRSPEWPDVEKTFRDTHPNCAACGERRQLNIHHKFPFHYVVLCGRPDLELDPRNLLPLCVRHDCEHHVLLGHLDDYESYNPRVLEFVKKYSGRTNRQIHGNAAWQKAAAQKPKPLDQMSLAEKDAFKKMLDGKFPPNAAIMARAVRHCRENLILPKNAVSDSARSIKFKSAALARLIPTSFTPQTHKPERFGVGYFCQADKSTASTPGGDNLNLRSTRSMQAAKGAKCPTFVVKIGRPSGQQIAIVKSPKGKQAFCPRGKLIC